MGKNVTFKTTLEIGAKKGTGYDAVLSGSVKKLNAMDRVAMKAGRVMLGTGVAAGTAVAVMAAKANETYSNFETQMKELQAISGATTSQYEQQKKAAMDAGQTTKFTAAESAEAMKYMALAGWDVNTQLKALNPMLKTTAATNGELKTTSDLVTDSMSAVGVGVEGMETYLDKVAMANNKANTNAEQLLRSLVKSGGAAKTLGVSMDDLITATGVLANNGTKAEESGTAMNSILTRIVSNSTAMKAFDKLGVSLWDADGKFVGLRQTLLNINDAMADYTDEQKATTMAAIAGVHRYSQFGYLLDSVKESTKDGASAWDTLESSISNSTGAMNKMYDTTTDTLANAKAIRQSALEDMQIRVVDTVSDSEKEFIQWEAEFIPTVTKDLQAYAQAHQYDFANAIESVEGTVEKAYEVGSSAVSFIVENKTAVIGALKGVAGGILAIDVAAKGASAVNGIKKFMETFGGAGGGVAGITLAASAAIAGYNAIKGAIDNANEKMAQSNLENHFGNIQLSLNEIDQLATTIIGEDTMMKVDALNEAMQQSETSLGNITDSLTDVEKNAWKINVGYSMDKDDYQSYATQLDTYTKNVEQYASDRGYEVHVSASLLFGDGSKQDTDISNTFKDAQQQLDTLGNELHDYLYNETNGALLDGIIDIDENKVVEEYQKKMQSIVEKMNAAETNAQFDAIEMKYSGADLDSKAFEQLQKELQKQVKDAADKEEEAYQNTLQGYEYKKATDSSYTDTQFEKDKAAAAKAYHKGVEGTQVKAADYTVSTVDDAYSGKIKKAMEDAQQVYETYTDLTNEETRSLWKNNPGLAVNNLANEVNSIYGTEITKADKKGLGKIAVEMKNQIEDLEDAARRYEEAGKEVPDAIKETLEGMYTIQGLSGNYDALSQGILSKLLTDDDFTSFVRQSGDEFTKAYFGIENEAKTTFSKGYDINTDIRLSLDTKLTNINYSVTDAMQKAQSYIQQKNDAHPINTSTKLAQDIINISNGKMPGAKKTVPFTQNAKGGFYDKYTITSLVEEGKPEAVQPLDGSKRAKDIWYTSGAMLGMFDRQPRTILSNSQQTAQQLIFNPTVIIQGNAKKADVQDAMRTTYGDVQNMLQKAAKKKARVTF